jgi:GTPase involved in cell partitioning and DNA repair
MKDSSKILKYVFIAVLLILFYLVFNSTSRTKEALRIIKEVNTELKTVQDSLKNAQQTIQIVLQKIDFTENELKLLKADRELLELEEQKKTARNWQELQKFKDEINRLEQIKEKLKQEAKHYEL